MKRRKQTELSHPNFVAVRLSDTEITILDQACASSGTTRSEYLRKLLTEKKIYNNVEIVADIKLLRELVGQYGKRFILCLHRSERECETFQSEKDWHISTESLFIVMKLVRVGELNA